MNSKGVPGADEIDNREQAGALRVDFVLPKGAYATTVLANAFDVIDGSRETGSPVSEAGANSEDGMQSDAKAEEE